MGAKPRKTSSAGKKGAGNKGAGEHAASKRAPAKRVPARRAAAPAAKPVRAAAVKTVDSYVAGLTGWQKEAAKALRQLVRAVAPDATESFKWGQPVYEDHGPFCFFKSGPDHIELGFWRGAELFDPEWRLEGDDDRVKHVKLRGAEDVTEPALAPYMRQAVELNRRLGNPTRVESVPRTAGEDVVTAPPTAVTAVVPVDTAGEPGGNGLHDDGY